jgi:hypothetical protein
VVTPKCVGELVPRHGPPLSREEVGEDKAALATWEALLVDDEAGRLDRDAFSQRNP